MIFGNLIQHQNILKTINVIWNASFPVILYLLSFSASGQSVILEISQNIPEQVMEWNLYDYYDHQILAGTEFAADHKVCLPLENNKKYRFQVILSDADINDSLILTLSLNDQLTPKFQPVILQCHDLML